MTGFPMPPVPVGTLPEQVQGQYAYLFQMAQLLNVALGELESGGISAASPAAKVGQGLTGAQKQQYNTLKSLIIKTADQVQRTAQQLTAQVAEQYVAQSDFGTYTEEMTATLEANARALTQYYHFASDLAGNVEAVDAAFSRYCTDTQGYIRTGIVYYDGAVPVYGVAVGQNLTVETVDDEKVVSPHDFRATFTAGRLSFWQDETEVAYVSNNRLYITNITVLGEVTLGRWMITERQGLAFRYIGAS